MACTTIKMIAAILLLILLAGGAVGLHFMQRACAQTPASQATTTNTSDQPPDNKTEFDRVYVLSSDQVLLRVKPPFPDGRMDFYQAAGPDYAQANHAEPDSMLLKWTDGKPAVHDMTFGNSYGNLNHLFYVLLGVFPQEVEGDASALKADLSGDFVFRPDASEQQYLDALQKMLSEATGSSVKLTLQDVDRSVIVLQGKWKYSAIDAADEVSHTVELYGKDRGVNGPGSGGGGHGNLKEWMGYIGQYINQQVAVDAVGVPIHLSWAFSDALPLRPPHPDKAHDAELVLKHIEEQTGLTCSKENRKVRRLIVAR